MKRIAVKMLRQYEQLNAGQTYNLPMDLAQRLISQGVAQHLGVGPSETKPAAPSQTKPSIAGEVKVPPVPQKK